MEWVETTAKTVDEATALALDQLGVDQADAEIEVLEEAKTGLFGRVRGEARIRARVRPTEPRAKEERRRPASKTAKDPGTKPARSPKQTPTQRADADGGSPAPARAPRRPVKTATAATDGSGEAIPADIEQAGRSFLEGLVEAAAVEATVDVRAVNENMIEFRVIGKDLGFLIGPKAQTLQAVQELMRTHVHYETQTASGRLLLDIGGYREKRKAALAAFTIRVVEEVRASGTPRLLEPMSPADRKVIHDCVNDLTGVASSSEGFEPNRYVVLSPA